MAAPSWKGFVQDLDVRNLIHFHPAPVGKLPAAHATHLVGQELDRALVSAIVMRFDDSRFAQVVQLDQAPLLDRGAIVDLTRDAAGNLYALVTHMVTNARLTISGPMGMRGARQYVKTYELSADGDTTVVRTSASMLGDIDDELLTGYRDGGEELLQAFKTYVETRRTA